MTRSIASSDPKERSEANAAYREVLSASVRELLAVWEQIYKGGDAGRLGELHRLAHNLNGASSLLGYMELGKAARMLEQRVALLIPSNSQLGQDEREELGQLTESLRRADPLYESARSSQGGLVE